MKRMWKSVVAFIFVAGIADFVPHVPPITRVLDTIGAAKRSIRVGLKDSSSANQPIAPTARDVASNPESPSK